METETSISTIDHLIQELRHCDSTNFKALGRRLSIPVSECERYAHFSEDSYARNCIARTDSYELLLLCWESGQGSPVHCHNEQECWVHVIEGKIEEERYHRAENGSPTSIGSNGVASMQSGRVSYMHDALGYHRLHNPGPERAMTLHLYYQPITKCRVFNEATHQFEWVMMSDYSMHGQVLERVKVQ